MVQSILDRLRKRRVPYTEHKESPLPLKNAKKNLQETVWYATTKPKGAQQFRDEGKCLKNILTF